MATHGPINGVKISRTCSGSLVHILARTRFSFRPLARTSGAQRSSLFWLFLAHHPPIHHYSPSHLYPATTTLRPVLEYVIVDVIIMQPSMIPERWSRLLPPMARPGTPVTSRTRIVKSSAMARLASFSKPNLSPNMRTEMTLPSRRSYRTSDSR